MCSRALGRLCSLCETTGGDFLFQPLVVFQQAASGELQQIKSEFRILEIQQFRLLIADFEHFAVRGACHGLGAGAVRREQGDLADHVAGRDVDAEALDVKSSRDDEQHGVRRVALAEQRLAGLYGAAAADAFQPLHVGIAPGGGFHLAHQHDDLPQAEDIHRQQHAVQDQHRRRVIEIAVADEEDVAHDADDAQPHHGFHREGQENKKRGDVTETVTKCHECPLRSPVMPAFVSVFRRSIA